MTYSQYKTNNGTLEEQAFNKLLPIAEAKLNYFTFNRLSKLEELPDNVLMTLTKYVDYLDKNKDILVTVNASVKSYDNGIEKISYGDTGNDKNTIRNMDSNLCLMAKEYLSETPELMYRGVC